MTARTANAATDQPIAAAIHEISNTPRASSAAATTPTSVATRASAVSAAHASTTNT